MPPRPRDFLQKGGDDAVAAYKRGVGVFNKCWGPVICVHMVVGIMRWLHWGSGVTIRETTE